MNKTRINEMRQKLKPFRNGVAYTIIRESPDNYLTEQGLCVKYAYELLDELNTPNDPSSPMADSTQPVAPKGSTAVGCSAWLGDEKHQIRKEMAEYGVKVSADFIDALNRLSKDTNK